MALLLMLPWFGMIYLMRSVLACFREITDLGSQLDGSVAEWSKALVLGTSLFGGVGSNPTTAISRKN